MPVVNYKMQEKSRATFKSLHQPKFLKDQETNLNLENCIHFCMFVMLQYFLLYTQALSKLC